MGEEGHCPVSREFLSLENQIGSQVPPTFLWHTDADQTVPVENALLFADGIKTSKGQPGIAHLPGRTSWSGTRQYRDPLRRSL